MPDPGVDPYWFLNPVLLFIVAPLGLLMLFGLGALLARPRKAVPGLAQSTTGEADTPALDETARLAAELSRILADDHAPVTVEAVTVANGNPPRQIEVTTAADPSDATLSLWLDGEGLRATHHLTGRVFEVVQLVRPSRLLALGIVNRAAEYWRGPVFVGDQLRSYFEHIQATGNPAERTTAIQALKTHKALWTDPHHPPGEVDTDGMKFV